MSKINNIRTTKTARKKKKSFSNINVYSYLLKHRVLVARFTTVSTSTPTKHDYMSDAMC